ncbi:transposase [Candidatus Uhrbacteria bacterium]|nr:transposase [Candidatus Uhrbacteria bacterium]
MEGLQRDRKPNRWKKHNYSANGWYFVTFCTKNRIEYFGDIFHDVGTGQCPVPTSYSYGSIATQFWSQIPDHYQHVSLDEWVIMPNHIHGIIIIDDPMHTDNVGTGQCPVPTLYGETPDPSNPENSRYGLLSKIIKSFKEMCGKKIRQEFHDETFEWQRSFHDHIIRNEIELDNIRKYIQDNPKNWHRDRNNQDKFR